MSNLVRIYVDETLRDAMEELMIDIAKEIKKTFNLDELTISGTFTSQVLAAKLRKEKLFQFKINKQGLNKGSVELA